MGWFKKEKSLFEKIQAKVAPTPAQKRSKSLRNAVSTFKKELHKKTKPSAIDRVARRKKPENILTHAKALANATKTTADKHGKSVRKALFDESKHKTKKLNKTTRKVIAERSQNLATSYNAIMGTEIARSVDSFLRDASSSSSNVYDKAMDAARIESGHLGGDHRLFDGGHTLSAAWERVKDAVPDDTFVDELRGYVTAIKNDVITPEGLPIKTLSKDDFDRFISETGVPAEWARDVASFTGTEVLGASIASIAIAMNWDEKDCSKFSEFVGGTAIAATAGANPLLGLLSVSAAAIAYQAREDKKEFVKDAVIGAAPTAAMIATSGVIGGPAAVGLLAGAAVGIYTSRILHKENVVVAEAFTKERILRLKLADYPKGNNPPQPETS